MARLSFLLIPAASRAVRGKSDGAAHRVSNKNPLPGLDPGIHVFAGANIAAQEDVGSRGKPGHGVSMVVTQPSKPTRFGSPDSPARKREARAVRAKLVALDARFREHDGLRGAASGSLRSASCYNRRDHRGRR